MIWSYNKGYYYKYHCLCLTLPHSEVSIYPDLDLNNNKTAKEDLPRIYQYHNKIEDVETTKEDTAKPKCCFHN